MFALKEEFDEMQIAVITSAITFASKTSLRDLKFNKWRETDLTPVLTALQEHPALEKIHFTTPDSFGYLPCPSGLELLLRSPDSKVRN
jgi:hypothetical protein